MNEQRVQMLELMGIKVWQLRELPADLTSASPAAARANSEPQQQARSSAASFESTPDDQCVEATPATPETAPNSTSLAAIELLDWQQLQSAVSECRACALSQSRQHTVFGSGDAQARLMIIGEAPGAEEDRQGLPFVGRAGGLLTQMLKAIGFERDQVFIANTLKCRPPNNRDPKPEEVQACAAFLKRQVDLIQPRVILALGRIAAHNVLNTTLSLARLRGTAHQYADTDIPVYVSYHPAYLLRSPADKAKAWQDLKVVAQLLGQQ